MERSAWGVVIGFIGIVLNAMLLGVMIRKHVWYKQGCIDALTGKPPYELRESDDGSRQWMRVEQQATEES
jgi:hypothetical protein